MQINPKELERQQLVMKHLKFYNHKIDGIWGPASIAAKRLWEASRSFAPAYPSNGLPFGYKDVLPKGVSFCRTTRVMQCVHMSDTVIAELLGEQATSPVEQAVTVPTPTVSVTEEKADAPVIVTTGVEEEAVVPQQEPAESQKQERAPLPSSNNRHHNSRR